MRLPSIEALEKVYGEGSKSMERFQKLAERFLENYHGNAAEFFSAPGRTEIIGNHTDHNGGKVIAASINMDTIGAAQQNGTDKVRITSEGYQDEVVVDLTKLDAVAKGQGTEALLAGILEGAVKYGFRVSGFDACVSTNVIAAAGVSSSASFEMLICSMINHFFNGGAMSCVDYAKIGKYSENVYWKKASGMMDQMACAVGGPVLFDFSNGECPDYRKLDFSFQDAGYQLFIVNTGKGHADLSQEYSEIPMEMRQAAAVLGVESLCDTDLDQLLSHCTEIKNDRAILRALHFFTETDRVKRAAQAIEEKKTDELLRLLEESGTSSWEWLQNCYSLQNCTEQKVPLALALSQLFLRKTGDGICRIHGGGFAGVIMCLVPHAKREHYMEYISRYVGKENVYPMDIRAVGAVHIA